MSDIPRWWTLPVAELFSGGNWAGQRVKKQLDSPTKTVSTVQLSEQWQLSSVRTFFDTFPWSGERLVVNTSSSIAPSSFLEPSACLTISVAEFFRLVPWGEGMSKVSSPPKPAMEMEFIPPAPKEPTIDDLAQLF